MNSLESLAVLAQVILVLFGCYALTRGVLEMIARYSGLMTPVFVDGLLFTLLSVWASMMAVFQSDEVYKYCNPYFVFYTKSIISVMLAGATSLKAFRSTSYGKSLDEKRRNTDTQFTTKP